MIPALLPLDPFLTGDYAAHRDSFAVAGVGEAGAGEAGVPLADPAAVGAALTAFTAPLGPARRVAAVSQWTKSYFAVLTVPSVAATLLLDCDLPLSPEGGITMLLGENGRPTGFHLPGDARPLGPDRLGTACGFTRFSGLIDDHLAAIIPVFATAGGVPQRMIWSNAADYLDRAARMLVPLASAWPGREAAAAGLQALLATPDRPDGSPNLLHEPVRLMNGLRTRKVCCLRYAMPGEDFCGSCPKRRRAEAARAARG